MKNQGNTVATTLIVPCETTIATRPIVTTHHSVPHATGSPLAKNAAIAKMASGSPSRHLNLEAGMAHAKQTLAAFKSKVASN
jgi:hypothetical protein